MGVAFAMVEGLCFVPFHNMAMCAGSIQTCGMAPLGLQHYQACTGILLAYMPAHHPAKGRQACNMPFNSCGGQRSLPLRCVTLHT